MTPGAQQRARDLIQFADGLDEGGFPHFAAKARMVARDSLDAVAELEAERSVRRALQERCERQQDILGKAVYRALAAV